MRAAAVALLLLGSVIAQNEVTVSDPSNATASITTPSGSTSSAAGNNATETSADAPAVPSATVPPQTPVPGQELLPPPQSWCNDGGDGTYCPGALLQDVQLAGIFSDSKTFVDKPTKFSLNETVAAFNALGSNKTVQDMVTFVEKYFKPERQELEAIPIEGFVESPKILDNVTDPIYHAWVSKVNSYWTLLIRQTNETALCKNGECESSLIPLNHTIVVPGGRYGEIYYWDSYWILHGLLASELNQYAWNLLQNFMDMIETYGFFPNGGRKYYLNRSQPPVFAQMVDEYVRQTGNVTILERALPILHDELEWFKNNRTIEVTSPYSNRTFRVAHYAVDNSAPRPEGYVEDYETVMGASPPLNESQRADLYSELASGAESGWDYSSRWCKEPMLNKTNNEAVLRTLNIRAMIPVDLSAILAGDHSIVARLYETWESHLKGNQTPANPGGELGSVAKRDGTDGNSSATPVSSETAAPSAPPTGCFGATGDNVGGGPGSGVAKPGGECVPTPNNTAPISPNEDRILYHRSMAANYTDAINDLHWDPVKAFWYDFNTTSMERSSIYTPAGLWPLWQNITPVELSMNETMALQVASGLRYILGRYAGSPSVASLLHSGLQWDFPNIWPPHVHTTIKAVETLDRIIPMTSNVSTIYLSNYSSVAPGQLGLEFDELPPQPEGLVGNTSLTVPGLEDLRWTKALAVEIASRYMTSAFCSWYSTGGSLPGVLDPLPMSTLNISGTYFGGDGHMFEKFNVTDPDAAGGGGEYDVVVGFGWTNGVVLWATGKYGEYFPAPSCPLLPSSSNDTLPNPPMNETAPVGNDTAPSTENNNTAPVGNLNSQMPSSAFRRASIFGFRFF